MSKSKVNRRRHPRAKGIAGLTVGTGSDISDVQVEDISLSGLSFRIRRPIEFMTRLAMTLVIPLLSNRNRRSGGPLNIQCEGAVVRCDPVGDRGDQYEIGVFFTHLDEKAREVIEKYVNIQLETRAKLS